MNQTIYDKLKNIHITNEGEPRIKFEVVESCKSNDGVITEHVKKYDVCLSLIFGDARRGGHMEEIIADHLKEIYEQASYIND